MTKLIGHEQQQTAFLDARRSGRMHHAWLLAGPPGIGKARFALAAATHVLAGAAGPAEGIAPDHLDVDPEHRIARLIRAGSHLDLRILERAIKDKDGALASNISVDQVRELQPLFQGTPSLSPWRAVIVDSVDAMNRAAANAFLKNLEEPPENTVFLLISHAPGRLLPTIRSRCRLLRFHPLIDGEVGQVLEAVLPEAGPDELGALVAVAAGSPGRAMRFAGLDVAALNGTLAALARADSRHAPVLALDLAKSLASKTAQPRFEAFLELAPAFLAEASRTRSGPRLARALSLWEKAHALSAQAVPLSLDPQSVALELASLVGALDP